MSAIAGTYSDLKFIRTRKVAQVVIEIPIEQAGQVVDLFGTPRPDSEVWVALARLDPEKLAGKPNGEASGFGPDVGGSTPPPAAKRRFEDMLRSQQAGMLCADQRFRDWMLSDLEPGQVVKVDDPRADIVVSLVRQACGVRSRANLDYDEDAASCWDALVAEYRRSQPVPDEHLPARIG